MIIDRQDGAKIRNMTFYIFIQNEKFLEYADRVIENGSHDAINVAAGFPGNAREMIAKGEWDLSKINLLHAIHFWDEEGKKYFMYGWELPETGVEER